jgi:hypothetical protein
MFIHCSLFACLELFLKRESVGGFHVARTWVPREGPKGFERRGLYA